MLHSYISIIFITQSSLYAAQYINSFIFIVTFYLK